MMTSFFQFISFIMSLINWKTTKYQTLLRLLCCKKGMHNRIEENAYCLIYRVFRIIFFTNLSPLPRQHWAAIGRSENGQPIGVILQSHYIEIFEDLLQRYVGWYKHPVCFQIIKTTFLTHRKVSLFDYYSSLPTIYRKLIFFIGSLTVFLQSRTGNSEW